MDELNRKLLEFAGFQKATQEEYSPGSTPRPDRDWWGWRYPEKLSPERYRIEWYTPDFPKSFNAIFQYLVPKYIAEVSMLPMGLTSIVSIYKFLFAEWLKFIEKGIEPALALCCVIKELIDSKETGDGN